MVKEMASHMSSIGFPVQSVDEFKVLAKRAVAQAANTITIPGVGYYRQWSPGAGVELWADVNQQIQILGLNPHFDGKARMRVKLVKRVIHPKDTILEGAFYGWANPHSGVTSDGDYPFCFSAPDYRMHDALALPCEVSVQLAAFPREVLAFENQDQAKSSNTWMSQLAPESCIPTGTFLPKGGQIDPPNPEIMFRGTVLETSLLRNSETRQQFNWARVRTLGGELDVAADPAIVKGTIKKNGTIGSMCWLSGRIK
jgi:hypothetical protein